MKFIRYLLAVYLKHVQNIFYWQKVLIFSMGVKKVLEKYLPIIKKN